MTKIVRLLPDTCYVCNGWQTVVNPDGHGTIPCPECAQDQTTETDAIDQP